MASPTSLRTRIRLSIRKSMNRLSSQKMTCCHWPSGRLMCFWAQRRRTSLALTVNLGTLPFAKPCRHAPPASYSPFGGKTAEFTCGCHARLSLCTLNRRFSLARRYSTRSSLSLVLRGRLVRLPQTKFPHSRNLLMLS